MAKKSTKAKDFESSIKELEQIITDMESGELSLEKSLQAFETGIKLTGHCQSLLSKAEQKVEVLMQEQEEQFQDFELDDDEYQDTDEE